MEDVVTMSLEKYDELIDMRYQLRDLKKEFDKAKMILMESNVDEYNIRNYPLETITDINKFDFGLKNKRMLLSVFSLDEMVEFIKSKKEELEKDD